MATLGQKVLEQILDHEAPAVLIAEGADAHYGSMERARQMISAAAGSGAQVVKFQHHIPEFEMLKETPMSSNMKEPLWDFLKRNALTIDQHVELQKFAEEEEGIAYLCTPFSIEAAKELEDRLDLFAYKIGSGELLDHPTLEEISKFEKPMIVSTGMSTPEEITETYHLLESRVSMLVLMNCTSAYPPLPNEMHLGFLNDMKLLFPNAIIGHSDHYPTSEFSIAAAALGARVIERHFTVDSTLDGPDAEVSLTVDGLSKLVRELKNLSQGLKSIKQVHPREIEIREWAHRSLVYKANLREGSKLEKGNIWGMRPGNGVPSKRIQEFYGRTLKRDVNEGQQLQESDFAS